MLAAYYALPGIADGGVYPGTTHGEWFDRDVMERTFLRRTEFMTRTGTPVWVGEFGPVYTGDPAADAQRYALLRDQLESYDAHHAGWSLWTYKDLGLQGLVTVPPDSSYARRIADVLAKKERLGIEARGVVRVRELRPRRRGRRPAEAPRGRSDDEMNVRP